MHVRMIFSWNGSIHHPNLPCLSEMWMKMMILKEPSRINAQNYLCPAPAQPSSPESQEITTQPNLLQLVQFYPIIRFLSAFCSSCKIRYACVSWPTFNIFSYRPIFCNKVPPNALWKFQISLLCSVVILLLIFPVFIHTRHSSSLKIKPFTTLCVK